VRKLEKLNIRDIKHLCLHLHCSQTELSNWCKHPERYYYHCENRIIKNKRRPTHTPIGRFSEIIYNLKSLLDRLELPEYLHGGIKEHSPKTNASHHIGKPAVLNFDIADFFPSINAYLHFYRTCLVKKQNYLTIAYVFLGTVRYIKGNAAEPDKDWKYVSLEELDKLLDACPDMGWKMLIALCRLAGLRRGEAMRLRWADINWEEHHFPVIAEKTGHHRVIPIGPKLYQLLLEAFDQAEESEERVCLISQHGLWRNFQIYRKRAGLKRWKDAFKVLRRNCETDWTQKYPQYAVSTWIGHNIQVSARHYLQIPAELYKKVATTNEAQTGTKQYDKERAKK